jgi:nucleoside-diphosphate-sugar epimerase
MRRIAVVGASGFVGTTVVEHLIAKGGDEVLPFIHSSGNAWRLARLGLDLKPLNLLAREEVRQALAGCTHVINCSRGGDAVMLDGLENLLAASRESRAARFVHLSSVMVYGDPPAPDGVTEEGRTDPAKGTYGALKLRQDQLVQKAAREGQPAVILCPPNIGGPYSGYYLEIVGALRAGKFSLMDGGEAPCNVVDVSNLAHAVELALENGTADGSRMFVTDDGATTWRDVVKELAPLAEMNEPVPAITREELLRSIPAEEKPSVSVLKSMKHIVSSDVREAIRKDPLLAKVDYVVRRGAALLGKSVEDRMRMSIEGPVQVSKPESEPLHFRRLCAQQLRGVLHSCERAKRELGYEPLYSFAQSAAAFRAWYRESHGMNSGAWDLLKHLY